MSLCFAGPGATAEHRWIVYALLRDNVQHHLEGGQPSPAFEAIHQIAEALGAGGVILGARQLRAEIETAAGVLLARPVADLAVSVRTRAILGGEWPPGPPGTAVAGADLLAMVPGLPAGARRLDQVFGSLVRSLLEVTANAGPDDIVEVTDL